MMTFVSLVPGRTWRAVRLGPRLRVAGRRSLRGRLRGGHPQHAVLDQAFWLFFGLASIGLRLSPFVAAVLTLTINFAAYVGEIIRAGLEATPRGEIEAADCLGLTPFQRIIAIELPQAVERMLRP